MFLKQLYRHHKLLFGVCLVFALLQLFLNFKQGFVVSPFYHYGMYSGKFGLYNEYEVFEVKANGKLLRAQDFSPQQWDKIQLPLSYMQSLRVSNQFFHTTISRLLRPLPLSVHDSHFLQTVTYPEFEAWYKGYLSVIIEQKIDSVKLYQRKYFFKEGRLQPTDSIITLALLCR